MRDLDLELRIDQLALADPVFAAASALNASTDRAWQSAVYLLSGDAELWKHFGPEVVATRSLQAVCCEALALYGYAADRTLDPAVRPSRHWRQIQTDLLVWTAFCWTGRWFQGPAATLEALPDELYDRWLTALAIHRSPYTRHGLLDT